MFSVDRSCTSLSAPPPYEGVAGSSQNGPSVQGPMELPAAVSGHKILCMCRLSRCHFTRQTTVADVQRYIEEKQAFLNEFCALYHRRALAGGWPEDTAFTMVDEIEGRVFKALATQQTRAVTTIDEFKKMRSLFPWIGDDQVSRLTVDEQERFVWARPYLQALSPQSAARVLAGEHWDGLVYMLNALPPNLTVFAFAFSWLEQQVDFCDLSTLMRALAYLTHLPECTTQDMVRLMCQGSVSLRPWWTHPIEAEAFSQLMNRLDSFRERLATLLNASKNRWNRLLPRGLASSLFSMRSPLVIEREILAIHKMWLCMPHEIQRTLYIIDVDIILFLYSLTKRVVWPGSEAVALGELLFVYTHLQQLGLGNKIFFIALQDAREEVLLRSDPFLVDRPLFDPCLALFSLSSAQVEEIRLYSSQPRELKQIFMRMAARED